MSPQCRVSISLTDVLLSLLNSVFSIQCTRDWKCARLLLLRRTSTSWRPVSLKHDGTDGTIFKPCRQTGHENMTGRENMTDRRDAIVQLVMKWLWAFDYRSGAK